MLLGFFFFCLSTMHPQPVYGTILAMPHPTDSEFDVIADLVHIEKHGIRLSEMLIETLAAICHRKGVSVEILIATVMWDYASDYNNNLRNELTEYQNVRDYGRRGRAGRRPNSKPHPVDKPEVIPVK